LTLTEVLMAVAILALVAAFAVPGFESWMETATVKKAARQLMTDLQFTKTKAISEGTQFRVRFDEGTSSYAIEKGNMAGGSDSWEQAGVERRMSDRTNPFYSKGVSLKQSFPNDAAIFSPIGSSAMGTVKMSSGVCTDGTDECRGRRCERCVRTILTGRIALAE
jgi:Tfp pilus assembly protein FimT